MKLRPAALALLLFVAVTGCDTSRSPEPLPRARAEPLPVATAGGRGFLKGQLHAHSNGSGDSETPPEEAAAWYAAHGYDFLVLTDHNRVTETPSPPGMLALRGVELTQNLRTCDPPPEPGSGCLLHVNALFVVPSPEPIFWERLASVRRVDLYGRAMDRALALDGIAQLDHPNFRYAADLEVVLALARRGLTLMEIANSALDSANEGDARHPSTEALWDAALAKGARIFGTATDDAHHYDDAERVRARGETAYVGDRGFVMVRADKSLPAIRAAVAKGDFYSSTGVLLDRLEMVPGGIDLEVGAATPPVKIEVIADGLVARTVEGTRLHHDPSGAAAYVRVRVTDGRGKRAWTQPVWLRGG